VPSGTSNSFSQAVNIPMTTRDAHKKSFFILVFKVLLVSLLLHGVFLVLLSTLHVQLIPSANNCKIDVTFTKEQKKLGSPTLFL
jgi:hypothetical protein